jgi:carbonic anhydrase/acetyltransferase-like protein (isoleucine patch superfamily)
MAIIRAWNGKAPRIHESVYVAENAVVLGDVEIGAGSSIWFGALVRGDVNHIRIGARTNVQDYAILHVTSRTHPTVVGDDVTLGHRVTLHGCTVKDRCRVGIGAVVMDGAVVGENSMVAAGSLVPPGMIIPPGMLAVGSPARVKRELTPEEVDFFERSAANYQGYAEQYRREGWGGR